MGNSYQPPVGPDLHFTITYNQFEASQPATFSFFNFGPSWNCAWLSYITKPTSTGGLTTVNTRGGGQEEYGDAYNSYYVSTGTTYPGYVGYYGAELQSQATLWVTTSGTYERRLPDGSKEVFGEVDPAGLVFLTSIIDPQGNHVDLAYDSSYRLTTITDPAGLTTTFTYGLSADPLKVTQITDPYGRSATFAYSSSAPYQLTSITDVVGITSNFTYGTGSAITQMTTPYGTTTFTAVTSTSSYPTRSLNVTEPDGSQVYAENRLDGLDYPYNTSGGGVNPPYTTEPVPSSPNFTIGLMSEYLMYRNTFYWDKKAMLVTSNNPTSDYTKAYIYHFLHSYSGQQSCVLESEKPAAENRIWYNENNSPIYTWYTYEIATGDTDKPVAVARVMSNGTTQLYLYQYGNTNNPGLVTQVTDPLGRQTNTTYATNGIDITQVTQKNGSAHDVLYAATYNSAHCPLTITDASGQTTTYTYNSQNQILTVTPPIRAGKSAETTTYGYTGNYLTSITGPLSGAVTSMTYDTVGGHTLNRVKTRSDAESHTLTYTYDNLDRITQIAYPDSTTEIFSYLNPTTSQVDLDLHASTDRLGRTTTRTYDSTRHLLSVTDPLSRTNSYGWCSCGSLISMTDPKGNITTLNYDLESRLTSKVYQDATQTSYTYDSAVNRLATSTDARGNVATYSYNLDNMVSGISYALAGGTAATPNVSYIYDPNYNRITTINGVSYGYGTVGSPGGNQVTTVTNTLSGASPAVTYGYDEWGRVVSTTVAGDAARTKVFDSLGRVTNEVNDLCPTGTSFAYAYFDPTHPTNRLGSVTYPSPSTQSTVYNYFGNTGDERLQEIKNLNGSSVLSQHDYTYDAIGKILTWQQQTDSNTPLLWTEGYDAADQLTSATQTNTAITSPPTVQDTYGYDSAGNMTSAGLSGVSRASTFNNVNWLTGSTVSGNQNVHFTGLLNTSATVTVNGTAATVSGTNFNGATALTPGTTNTVAVVAQDVHGNIRTNHYQTIVPAQPACSPTYDVAGNELTNGAGQTYTWDAKNELASITYTGGATTTFGYDAIGQRISIVEKNSGGTVTSTKQFVWDGSAPIEERDATGTTVTKRFFPQGEQIAGTSNYYTFDHLGSVREMTDSTGAIQARYDYDPYGRPAEIQGGNVSDFQYAGYYGHQTSGLNLTKYRAYDPIVSRWLSRDPLKDAERKQGPNLYGYVRENAINLFDPFGLGTWTFTITSGGAGHRPNVDAFYTMSADESKCCSSVEVRRSTRNFGFWMSDDTGNSYTDPKGNAHAEGDSPGGSKFLNNWVGDGSGTDLPSFPQTIHFKWDAVCTGGDLHGKTLSSQQRDYFVSGYNGAWESSDGSLSIP